MTFESIDKLLLQRQIEEAWELYHENSKLGRLERHSRFALPPSDATIVQTMQRLRRVKPYEDFPKIDLPEELPASARSLEEVMVRRESARRFGEGSMYVEELAKILFMAYGLTRNNQDTDFPRPFRTIPSGGALFPLEIYVVAARVEGIDPGLYHYDPEENSLDVLRTGEELDRLARHFIQPDLVRNAAAALLVSAVFVRSTFKYADRGYRFVLLEAGHLGQNVLLTAGGLDLAAVPIGGYVDRELDRTLGLDGLNEFVIYALLLGDRR